ncbi:leucine-rich repeat domain-containing protein [bacterium]|jgi:hypothetical protein|nr:leucine-rich repeat domain-containing protein [bacterium]
MKKFICITVLTSALLTTIFSNAKIPNILRGKVTIHRDQDYSDFFEAIERGLNANATLEDRSYFERAQNIITLVCRNFKLDHIPSTIKNLSSLTDLILEDTLLSSFPEQITELHSLRCLDLQNNQIKELPDSIGDLNNLQQLKLKNNHISSLPESLTNLKKLFLIDLSNNWFNYFPTILDSLPNLQVVLLAGNEIEKIPPELFKDSTIIWQLDMSNNPLERPPIKIGRLKLYSEAPKIWLGEPTTALISPGTF